MTLRRGFEVQPDDRILVVEDVTTTGGSVLEVIETLKAHDGNVVAVSGVVDRSGGNAQFGVPYFSLFQMEVTNFDPANCPLCAAGSTAVKPGSRGLK